MIDVKERLEHLNWQKAELENWLAAAEPCLSEMLMLGNGGRRLTIVNFTIDEKIAADIIACFEGLVNTKQEELNEVNCLIKKGNKLNDL